MLADSATAARTLAYDIPPSIVANSSPQRNSHDAAFASRAKASGSAISPRLNVRSVGLSNSATTHNLPAPDSVIRRRFHMSKRAAHSRPWPARRHSGSVDRAAAEGWIRAHVEPVGAVETARERPWATVLRVPLADSVAWFTACAPVQAFEPRLTAALFARWPDRVPEVLGRDEGRAWLLLADAGTPIRALGNPPEAWLAALPRYAELQRGEAAHAEEHVAHGVPDLRVATLPARYEDLLRRDLPLESGEIARLRGFAARFAFAWARQRDHLPEEARPDFDRWFPVVLRRAVARTLE